MMKRFTVFMMVFALVFMVSGISQADLLAFTDDFDDGTYLDKWEIDRDDGVSTITESGTELHVTIQKPSNSCDAVRLDTIDVFSSQDMIIEAEIKQVGKGGSGIRLKRDDNNQITFRLNTNDVQCVQFFSADNGVGTKQQCIESSSPYLGQYNLLRIIKTGDQYEAYLNGVKKGYTFTNTGVGDTGLVMELTSSTCEWKSGNADNYFDSATVWVSNLPPVADAGPNVSISTEEQIHTIIYGIGSDPENEPLTYKWLEGVNELTSWQGIGSDGEAYLELSTVPDFSIGQHTLTLKVSDSQDNATDEMILTIDNSAPNAAPSGGGVYEINTPVTLGGEISDFDGDMVTYKWLEGENVLFTEVVETIYGGEPIALLDHIISDFSLGTHILTLSVNDGINESVESNITVEVIDTIAPTLAPVSNKTILWPPDHKMVDIIIEANVSDNSCGPVTLSAMVSSNEPENGLGDGDTAPDWTEPIIDQENGIVTLQLRAERSGSGDGHIYTITITAADETGNSSQSQVEIIVPHDQ